MTHVKPTLFVCCNCPNEKQSGPCACAADEGEALFAALQERVGETPVLAKAVTVAQVACMGGCETPCSVAFAAPGKESLLFGHMGLAQVEDILACFTTYVAGEAGHRMAWAERPASMQKTLMVRIPAPGA